MFDFEDIEGPDDAGGDGAEQETPEEAAQRTACGLEHGDWKTRWDSCRELAKLGTAAAPYMYLLEDLAEREKDQDVRKAASKALDELHAAGVQGSEPDPEVVQQAADDLGSQDFCVRRNACRTLGKLGALAAPHLLALQQLSEREKDYEVRQAARDALRKLRSAGVCPEKATASTDAGGGTSSGSAAMSTDWWPEALFEVDGETLPMRLPQEDMTPAEIAKVWESWGVRYAGRVIFTAPEDSEVRRMRPREDIVPRTPFVTGLLANSGPLLQDVVAALRLYGSMTPEEVAADREHKLQEQMLAAERRAAADAREDDKYKGMDHRRRWRLPLQEPQDESAPAQKPRMLFGRTKLGSG